MKETNNYKWFWVILCALIFLPILIFGVFFFEKIISDDISDWAAFGGYISGTVGSILVAANLYIFYKLTRKLNKNQEFYHIQAIETQKKIVANQLKFEYVREITKVIVDLSNKITKVDLYNIEQLTWEVRSVQWYLWYYLINIKSILEHPGNAEDFNESLVELADILAKGQAGNEERDKALLKFIDESTKFMENLNAQVAEDL